MIKIKVEYQSLYEFAFTPEVVRQEETPPFAQLFCIIILKAWLHIEFCAYKLYAH